MAITVTRAIEEKIARSDLALTQFRDRDGFWAKDEMFCYDVLVQCADGSTYEITFESYRTLSKDVQDKIKHARSSPA